MTASKQEGREHEQKSGECTFGQSYDKCGEYKNCDDCMKMEPSWLSKRDALVAQQERERVYQKINDVIYAIEENGEEMSYDNIMHELDSLRQQEAQR